MRIILAGAMVTTMALALLSGTVLYAAVRPDVGAPMVALVLITALLYAVKLVVVKGSTWKHSPMHWPAALFLVYTLIRYFTSPFEHDARLELFQVLVCGLAYFIAANQFYRPLDRTVILAVVVLLVLFESAYGLWQCTSRAAKVLNWVRMDTYQLRAGGTFACPNNLATFLEMGLGLLLSWGLLAHLNRGKMERSLVVRLTVLYAALMAVVGIIASFSRAGWVATIAGLLIFSFWGRAGARIPWSKLVGIGVVGAMMGLAAWKVAPVRDYILEHTWKKDTRNREEKVVLQDPTFGGRRQMWKGTVQLIAAHPVFGTGIGSWQWVYQKVKDPFIQDHPEHAHNDILHVASDYGLVGFVLMAWLFVGFFRQAKLLRHEDLPSEQRAFAIGSAVAISTALIHAWFDFPFHIQANSLLLALLLGCTTAMEDPSERYPRVSMPAWARYGLAAGLVVITAIAIWFYIPTARGVYYSEAGNDAKRLLDWDFALDMYQSAMKADPNHAEPHWKTGDIYRTKARWMLRLSPDKAADATRLAEFAIPHYQRALELNPLLNEVLLRQGAAFELIGQEDRALTNYLRAAEISPVNAFNLNVLGRYFRKHGDDARALQYFSRAQTLNSSSDNSSQLNMLELEPPEDSPPSTNAPTAPAPTNR